MQRQDAPLILLTRPAQASARFAARLALAHPGAQVLISPLQEVRFLDWPRPEGAPDALIFTSQNAVEAAARAGLSGRAFCVGDQTRQAAMSAGFGAVSAGGDAQDLVALIRAERPQHLWHLHGRDPRGDVAGQLRAEGFTVAQAVVYETLPMALTAEALAALAGDRNLLVPLFSPKSAALAAAALAGAMAPLVLLCLIPAVEQSLGVLAAHPRAVARRPDADGMLEIIARALNSGALP